MTIAFRRQDPLPSTFQLFCPFLLHHFSLLHLPNFILTPFHPISLFKKCLISRLAAGFLKILPVCVTDQPTPVPYFASKIRLGLSQTEKNLLPNSFQIRPNDQPFLASSSNSNPNHFDPHLHDLIRIPIRQFATEDVFCDVFELSHQIRHFEAVNAVSPNPFAT